MNERSGKTIWLPDLLYTEEGFRSGLAVVCNQQGLIEAIIPEPQIEGPVTRLPGRAMLPGLINAHSHAFQRVIRGRTEYRTSDVDSFWTWREMMYSASERLTPEDIYAASRMAFLEMALSGITAVGEFHYLHNQQGGGRYDDPILLAKTVIGAARDVGLRIVLLKVAYFRSGYHLPENPRQRRFIKRDAVEFLGDYELLKGDVRDHPLVSTGIAPHSIRAVDLKNLKTLAEYAGRQETPLHMHVAEQVAELQACEAEYGTTPVELLAREGVLSNHFTAVHAVHISENEATQLGRAGAMVCACPTTERNLGDGIVPAKLLLDNRVRISLGTDSQAQIDLLEDARELELHPRLQKQERAVLAKAKGGIASGAQRLFVCATTCGAASLDVNAGLLEPGRAADFFTVDLNDPSVAGASAESLLPCIIFSAGRAAVKDIFVAGKRIVTDGTHPKTDEIIKEYRSLQRSLWGYEIAPRFPASSLLGQQQPPSRR